MIKISKTALTKGIKGMRRGPKKKKRQIKSFTTQFVFQRREKKIFEKIVGNGEKADNMHTLLFLQRLLFFQRQCPFLYP